VVSLLSLPPHSSGVVELGDASRKAVEYYAAEILWDGQPRKIRVLCIEGDPLIGTALLRDYKLESHFVVNGPVVLTMLS